MNVTPTAESTSNQTSWQQSNTQGMNEHCRLQADFARRQAEDRPVPYSVAQAYRRVIELRRQN